MKIFIDADSCPVLDITLAACRIFEIPAVIVHADAIKIKRDDAEIICCRIGANSADRHILDRVTAGDVVITNDSGLAGLCLDKKARAINSFGIRYQQGPAKRSSYILPLFPTKRTLNDDLAFVKRFLDFLDLKVPKKSPRCLYLDYSPKSYIKVAVAFCEIFNLPYKIYTSGDPYFTNNDSIVTSLYDPTDRAIDILGNIRPDDIIVAQRTELEIEALKQKAHVLFLNGECPGLDGYEELADGTQLPHPAKHGKDLCRFTEALYDLIK